MIDSTSKIPANGRRPKPARREGLSLASAWFIFAACVFATLYFWTLLNQGLERYASFKFDSETRRILYGVEERLQRYATSLYGATALFSASQSVEKDEWAAFADTLDVKGRYPGISAFRFSERLEGGGIVVRYAEPLEGNERMIGYDQSADPLRAASFERSRDTGELSLTPPVSFVNGKKGFLLILPVYARSSSIDDVDSRRRALAGYVDLAIDCESFFGELFREKRLPSGFEVRILDGDAEQTRGHPQARFLFSNRNEAEHGSRFRSAATFEVFGRTWTLHASSDDRFFGLSRLERRTPSLALAGGLALCFLVFAVLYSVARSERRAHALAREMTRESRAFAAIVESADDAIYSKTLDGVVLTWNRGAEKMYGYPAGEIVGRSASVLFPEDRSSELAEITDRIGRGYRIHNLETVRRRRDGALLEISLTVSPIRDERGNVCAAAVIARDVTAKKQGERRLAEINTALFSSQARQKAILDNIPDIAWLKDCEGRYIAANEAFAASLGRKPEDIPGLTDFDLWPRELAERYRADDREVMETGLQKRVDEPIQDLSGRRWIETVKRPLRDAEGRVVGTAGIARDITERREAARRLEDMHSALRESEERYRSLVANFPGVIYRCAPEKNWAIEYMSARIESISGYPARDFTDGTRTFSSVIHSSDLQRVTVTIFEAVKNRQPYALEYRIVRPDGGVRWIWERGQALYGEDGAPRWLDGAMLDVTENKDLEQHVRQAQKMETVGTLAGGIAHDLNNQLTPALGYLDLLQKQLGQAHPAFELLADARLSTERCVQVVQRLLDFSHKSSSRKETVDIERMMADLRTLLVRALPATIRLEIQADAGLWKVNGNDSELQSAFMNLITNARDAMPSGGLVSMTAENASITAPPNGLQPGRYVRFTVRDNGTGMTPEVRAKVFEPFFTTKRKGQGTGLGLAMVFKNVRDHGGWIELDSEPGQGATFRIYLPADREGIDAGKSSLPSGLPQGGTETVLFADDEEPLRKLGRTFLERLGYKVLLAADGEEAVRIYQAHGSEIGAVVLDMTMPKMTGRQAFKRILEINPAARVILASGYTQDGSPDELAREGVVDFLAKPFTIHPLARTLRKALDPAA